MTGDADHTITIGPLGFDPPVLAVEPGDIIEWVNVDGTVHSTSFVTTTVTGGGRSLTSADSWESGLLSAGDSYKRQLTTPATYTYQDDANPAYTAQIVVTLGKQKLYLPLIKKDAE